MPLAEKNRRFLLKPLGSKSSTTKAIITLTILLIAFCSPFFFQGKQFSPMDALYSYFPWRTIPPDWYQVPSNALRWDDVSKYYPVRMNLIRNFEQDGMTFWQTDHLFGSPNRPTINWYGELLYPLVWLFFLLPFKTANSLIHILNLLIAGVSMWLLLREHTIPTIPALAGAIVYMFNGFFIVWMSAFFLPGMLAVLPLALFLYERAIRRRHMVYILAAALVTALQFYLGYPPGSMLFLVFFGLYALISFLELGFKRQPSSLWYSIRSFGVIIIIALALSTLYLIPTVQQLTNSEYMVSRATGGHSTIPTQFLLGFIVPNFWGNPTNGLSKIWHGGWGNYCELIAYWGISALVVASFGLIPNKKRLKIYVFSGASLVLALSIAYGIWPLNLLGILPGLSGITIGRWQFGLVLAGSLFTALGLEFLDKIHHKKKTSFWVLVLLITTGSIVFSSIASPNITRKWFSDYPRFIQSHLFQIGLGITTITLIGIRTLATKRLGRSLCYFLLLAIIFIDLFNFGSSFNPYIADDELYPKTPGIRFLQSQQGLFRISSWGSWTDVLPVQTANVYGLAVITGLDHYRDLAYRAFLGPLMSTGAKDIAQRYGYLQVDQNLDNNSSILDLLNVRFLISSPKAAPLNLDNIVPVYDGPDMKIYRNLQVAPRAWGILKYHVVSNEHALNEIHKPDFDARTIVYLEDGPDIEVSSDNCGQEELVSEVVGYAQDEIVIETDFECNGVLVISERYADGWSAKVDNQDTSILRANYLLRAVAVPAGKHQVRLLYQSSSHLWGLGISLCALVLFCGVLGFLWKRWRGTALLGILIPVITIVWFGKPFKEPVHPAERWVEIGIPAGIPVAPNAQQAFIQDEQGELAFLGYELDKTSVAPGGTLRLTLYWQGVSPVSRDYTVFTHLIDNEGRLLTQKDQPPIPTSTWQDGQIVTDIYYLQVNPDAPNTLARLVIGMYDWHTLERIPFHLTDGNRLANDALILDNTIKIH